MTLAAPLLNVPITDRDFDRWSFDLQQNLMDVTRAILTQRNVSIPLPQLYPAPLFAIGEWLQRLSQTMIEISNALGTQTQDIENVNLEDERERQAWTYSIWQQVQQARQVLGV